MVLTPPRHVMAPIRRYALGLSLCIPLTATAQLDPASADNPLHHLRVLEGSWSGELEGTLGAATGQRRYRFILRDRFLFMVHDRDPQSPAPPADDAHDEWSIFSYDPERNAIMLREFLVEGFVNTYRCELDLEPKRLTCESDTASNESGVILKLRYEFTDLDHFIEMFEIYGSDGVIRVRMDGRWRRYEEEGG